jgi:hypothetical protein
MLSWLEIRTPEPFHLPTYMVITLVALLSPTT